jgi:hypothetical protein
MTARIRYVDERLAVFHEDLLGYPSIGSCHAIGYLTTRGLYGYHNLGGESSDRWGPMATKFGAFVEGKSQGGESGLGLYGCAHVSGQRGYASGRKREAWTEELVGFASKVGWGGAIWGYDLTGFDRGGYNPNGSGYVEFRKVGLKCLMYVRQWREHENITGEPDGNFAAIARPSMPGKVTTSLQSGGGALFNVDPERLR